MWIVIDYDRGYLGVQFECCRKCLLFDVAQYIFNLICCEQREVE